MQQRQLRLPAAAQYRDQRGRSDGGRDAIRGSAVALDVAGGGPAQQLTAQDQMRPAVGEDEGAIRKVAVRTRVKNALAGAGDNALGVKLCIDCIGPVLPRV